MIIITDSPEAPDGYATSYYNEFWVHYDPSIPGVEEMIADANAGDDRELRANAVMNTPHSRQWNVTSTRNKISTRN